MTGAVKYAYGNSQVHYGSNMIYYRATKVRIDHNTTESIPLGRVNFKPYGYWYYEIYEVTYNGDIGTLTATNTPQEETGTSSDTSGVHGTVRGKVEEGKLYVTETSGSEQVKYTTHTETTTNYLYTN